MSEIDNLMQVVEEAGGDRDILANKDIAHLAVSGHKILSANKVEGLEVEAKETLTGIETKVTVLEGVKMKNPVHLCFGVLHNRGTQKIKLDVRL